MGLAVRAGLVVPDSDLAALAARTHEGVADAVEPVASQPLIPFAEPDRTDVDVMGHH